MPPMPSPAWAREAVLESRIAIGSSGGLERGWAVETKALPGLRMGQGEHAGMQAKPLMGCQCLFMGVEPIAEQGMTDRQHVNAQLVGTPGDRRQLDAAVVAATLQ